MLVHKLEMLHSHFFSWILFESQLSFCTTHHYDEITGHVLVTSDLIYYLYLCSKFGIQCINSELSVVRGISNMFL